MGKIYLPREEQFDLMNENLAKIAGAIGSSIDISTWAGIQRAVRAGVAPSLMPIGTQLVVSHSIYGDMIFDVVAHNRYKSVHDPNAHTMTIMSHDSILKLQYDAPEAFYCAVTGLPAGTYNFTIGKTYASWVAGTYQFTLTTAMPAGGQLIIDSNAGKAMTECIGSSIASWQENRVIEQFTISAGNGGTSLGTFGNELNHSVRVAHGSNNYAESPIRVFLNSKNPMTWYEATKYDVPPTWWETPQGFLEGLEDDFLSVVGEVLVPCISNSQYESADSKYIKGEKYTLKDKFYLASVREITGEYEEGNPDYADDGTSQLPYYIGSVGTDRYKKAGGVAYDWCTRSPFSTGCGTVMVLNAGGVPVSKNARNTFGIAPVCTIV